MDPGSGFVALCGSGIPRGYLRFVAGRVRGPGPNRPGRESAIDHARSANPAAATREARDAARGRRSSPPRYRHKGDLRVYLKKVQ